VVDTRRLPIADILDLLAPDGRVDTARLAAVLRITRAELAIVSGVSRGSVPGAARMKSPAARSRLRDLTEVLHQASPWAGSLQQAFAWYRAQPLPSFGDRTPEDLVKEGHAEALKAYLCRIAEGGYA
jgi:hypothetical protein